ncbi:hypothetical protein [uncultured Algibacter sp.]|uniref:hypothetical protein n=1 Tax=uncultured Algibacter sp. TaxID=298659 RepID=UPI002605416B|nr:hypothetical protein [uncultured Algibacter sp.]
MITKKSKIWKYFSRLFLSIDQLGNAIAGGDPDNTISARVGYYNHHYFPENEKVPWYWSVFEKIINVTFCPADGPNHCHEAYHNDAGEIFDNRLTNILVAIAATIIIIPSCIVIAFILYLLSALGIVKRKTIERDKNLEKRLNSCSLVLISTFQEINEHGLDFNLENSKKQLKILLEKADKIKQAINSK